MSHPVSGGKPTRWYCQCKEPPNVPPDEEGTLSPQKAVNSSWWLMEKEEQIGDHKPDRWTSVREVPQPESEAPVNRQRAGGGVLSGRPT